MNKMIQYENEEKEIKDLIESNLRQRVLGNTNPVKLGRCFDFLNDYYGFTQGGNRGNQYTLPKEKVFTLANLNSPKNQSELIVDIKSVRIEVRCVFIIIVGIMELWNFGGVKARKLGKASSSYI